MNYEPNTTTWKRGDIVIHDADAKEAGMLMIVTGYTRDHLVKTQYVDPNRTRKIWKNESRYLLDPHRFDFKKRLMLPVEHVYKLLPFSGRMEWNYGGLFVDVRAITRLHVYRYQLESDKFPDPGYECVFANDLLYVYFDKVANDR